MNTQYQWHGEPVSVEFGFCMVTKNEEKPMYWYNYLVSISPEGKFATIPAIKITTKDGYSFCIANHHAYGIHKLIEGGWPNHGHSSLPLESFTEDNGWKFTEFDEKGLIAFQKAQDKWQEKNFPELHKKMEAAKKIANRSFFNRKV